MIGKSLSINIKYEWKRIDEYKFPGTYPNHGHPSIYTWVLTSKEGKKSYYLGQTDNLSRRVRFYMNPGPSQSTNIRINRDMKKSKNVELYILDLEGLKVNDKKLPSGDLKDPDIRKGLESLLIRELRIQKKGRKILNL